MVSRERAYGRRGVMYEWLKSYLTGRKQCVSLHDVDGREIRSQWEEVTLGVPQGSVLGPLMFLLYVNDLPDMIGDLTVLYADDTTSVVAGNNIESVSSKIQENLNKLDSWLINHNLQLNTDKTLFVLYGDQRDELEVDVQGRILSGSTEAVFLGTKIDSRLSWGPHIADLVSRLCRCNYVLRMIVNSVSAEAAISAYYAHVYSALRYGVMFWGNAVEVQRVFIQQKACIRTLFNLDSRESCKNTFKSSRMLTLPSIFVLECALFVKLHYNDFFKKFESTHNHHTRCSTDSILIPPKLCSSKLQRNVLYQCIKIFNHIPSTIKQLHPNKFKLTLKHFLIDEAIYAVDDFFIKPVKH